MSRTVIPSGGATVVGLPPATLNSIDVSGYAESEPQATDYTVLIIPGAGGSGTANVGTTPGTSGYSLVGGTVPFVPVPPLPTWSPNNNTVTYSDFGRTILVGPGNGEGVHVAYYNTAYTLLEEGSALRFSIETSASDCLEGYALGLAFGSTELDAVPGVTTDGVVLKISDGSPAIYYNESSSPVTLPCPAADFVVDVIATRGATNTTVEFFVAGSAVGSQVIANVARLTPVVASDSSAGQTAVFTDTFTDPDTTYIEDRDPDFVANSNRWAPDIATRVHIMSGYMLGRSSWATFAEVDFATPTTGGPSWENLVYRWRIAAGNFFVAEGNDVRFTMGGDGTVHSYLELQDFGSGIGLQLTLHYNSETSSSLYVMAADFGDGIDVYVKQSANPASETPVFELEAYSNLGVELSSTTFTPAAFVETAPLQTARVQEFFGVMDAMYVYTEGGGETLEYSAGFTGGELTNTEESTVDQGTAGTTLDDIAVLDASDAVPFGSELPEDESSPLFIGGYAYDDSDVVSSAFTPYGNPIRDDELDVLETLAGAETFEGVLESCVGFGSEAVTEVGDVVESEFGVLSEAITVDLDALETEFAPAGETVDTVLETVLESELSIAFEEVEHTSVDAPVVTPPDQTDLGTYVCYNINLETLGVVEWHTNLPRGAAAVDGVLYVASDVGVFDFSGSDDVGVPIPAYVATGLLDFGSYHPKRCTYAEVAASNDSVVAFEVDYYSQREGENATKVQGTRRGAGRQVRQFTLPRGVRAPYVGVRIANIDGSNIDFNYTGMAVIQTNLGR